MSSAALSLIALLVFVCSTAICLEDGSKSARSSTQIREVTRNKRQLGGNEGWMRRRGRPEDEEENQEQQNNNDLDLAARINAIRGKAWVADSSLFSDLTDEELQRLTGAIITRRKAKKNVAESVDTRFIRQVLPREFDSRKRWPECAKLMSAVRDQSGCRSCWAVALGSATTDRLCIQKAKHGLAIEETFVSEAHILTCSGAGGCENGGLLSEAVAWMSKNLLISGGPYRDGGCKPYPFPPRMWKTEFSTPKCEQRCQASFSQTYAQSKSGMHIKAIKSVYIEGSDQISEERMMREIMAEGPIVAAIAVYKDFSKYKAGIYNYTSVDGNIYVGGHAVRLIGWGEGPNYSGKLTKYWLGINSWNTVWGNRGVFLIRRGSDEVGIESTQVAFPRVELGSITPRPIQPPTPISPPITTNITIKKTAQSRPISLMSSANFNYVTAWSDGKTLSASSGTVGPWEKFELFPNFRGTNYAVLLAKSNEKYVLANPKSGGSLSAVTEVADIGPFNYFLIEDMHDGTFVLKALSTNTYVSSEINNNGQLMANRQQPSKWEKFWIENYQQIAMIPQGVTGTVFMKAKNNGKYVAICNNLLCASGQVLENAEPFVVVRNTDNTVSLRSISSGKYVLSGQQVGKLTLLNLVGDWARFYVKDMRDGTYALQAKVSKKYVSTELNHGAQLAANRDLPDVWEKFYIEGISKDFPELEQLYNGLHELNQLIKQLQTHTRIRRSGCRRPRNTSMILVEDASNSDFYERTSLFAGKCACSNRGELAQEFYKSGVSSAYGNEGIAVVCQNNFTKLCICTENGECFEQNEFDPIQLSIGIHSYCENNECHNYVFVIGGLVGDRGTEHNYFNQVGPLGLESPYLKAAAVSCNGCQNIRQATC